jgi:hypothetical protein
MAETLPDYVMLYSRYSVGHAWKGSSTEPDVQLLVAGDTGAEGPPTTEEIRNARPLQTIPA